MPRLVPVRALVLGAVVALPASLVFSQPVRSAPAPRGAAFHLELLRSEPAVNATLNASPQRLALWFSESIELATTSVKLTNARNEPIGLGTLAVDTAPLAPALVDVRTRLTAGKYTVTWRAAGDDNHPSTGKFSFVVK